MRAFSVAIVVFFLMPTAIAPGNSASETILFAEGWERGLAGWQVTSTDARIDCISGRPGCSLRVDAACCAPLKVHKPLARSVPDRIRVDYSFLGTATTGHEDSNFVVYLTPTTGLTTTVTAGSGSSNNGIILFSSGAGSSELSLKWTANTWYTVSNEIDFASRVSQITVLSASGSVLGRSAFLALPAGTGAFIQALAVENLENGGGPGTFRYDTIEVRDVTPPAVTGYFAEDFSSGLGVWRVSGTSASAECDFAGCHMRSSPVSNGQFLYVQRPVAEPIPHLVELSFRMRGGGTGDTHMVLYTSANEGVTIGLTAGAGKDGIHLFSTGWPSVHVGVRPSTWQWYTYKLTLDGLAGTAHLLVLDERNRPLAVSAPLPYRGSQIYAVSVESVGSGLFDYDDIVLARKL